MKLRYKLSVILVTILLMPVVFLWWASLTPLTPGKSNAVISKVDPAFIPATSRPKKLTIMTWNVAFMHGPGSEGTGYVKLPAEIYQQKLAEAAALIKKSGADLVLLQEIDMASSRTYFVDQVAELAKQAGLNYYATAVSWANNYIPFPYWPITQQFGVMNSGGAVLSRFPIEKNELLLFEHPTTNAWWYNLFYLYRYSQAVQIKIAKDYYWVLNQHLEAFDKVSRQAQATQLIHQIHQYHQKDSPILIVGGDLNAIAQESFMNKNYFGDSVDFYRPDSTIDLIRTTSPLKDSITVEEYLLNEKHYYTYPAHQADRKLDYLFVNEKFKINSAKVIQSVTISDHLPYLIEITL
ncbi:MAG: endonuclease/exonuclease/phosphatase family protein [Bacteriovoracaceae bacterium]|nr:endonuclease/exonuclease/phosphatase family protein [Bacteriovoracaceae bacterium]